MMRGSDVETTVPEMIATNIPSMSPARTRMTSFCVIAGAFGDDSGIVGATGLDCSDMDILSALRWKRIDKGAACALPDLTLQTIAQVVD